MHANMCSQSNACFTIPGANLQYNIVYAKSTGIRHADAKNRQKLVLALANNQRRPSDHAYINVESLPSSLHHHTSINIFPRSLAYLPYVRYQSTQTS